MRLITMDMHELQLRRWAARETFSIRHVQRNQSPIYEAHWFFGVSSSALPMQRGVKHRRLRLNGPIEASTKNFLI